MKEVIFIFCCLFILNTLWDYFKGDISKSLRDYEYRNGVKKTAQRWCYAVMESLLSTIVLLPLFIWIYEGVAFGVVMLRTLPILVASIALRTYCKSLVKKRYN